MGHVIDSFKSSLGLIRDNRVLLGVAFVFVLISTPVSILPQLSKTISPFSVSMLLAGLVLFFIGPFYTGGFLGMVMEAIERPTKLSTFVEMGKKNYVSLLGATVVFFIILGGLTMGMALGGSFFLVRLLNNSIPLSGPVLVFLIMGLTFIVVPILMFFLQFFDIGIVANNYGALGTFRKSFGFARKRLLSVFYYTILRFLLIMPLVIPNMAMSIYRTSQMRAGLIGVFTPMPTDQLVIYTAINVFLGTILAAIMLTFHGVFYIRSQDGASSSQ